MTDIILYPNTRIHIQILYKAADIILLYTVIVLTYMI